MNKLGLTRTGEILQAAARLFAERGYDGVSVRDICSDLGMNCSMVSYYFGGKAGLYQAVLEQLFDDYGRILKDAEDRQLNPREGLESILAAAASFRTARPHLAALIRRESAGRPSRQFEKILREHEILHGSILESLIRNGQRQGLFRSNLKAESAAEVLNSLLCGGLGGLGRSREEGDFAETWKTMVLSALLHPGAEAEVSRTIGKQTARPRAVWGR